MKLDQLPDFAAWATAWLSQQLKEGQRVVIQMEKNVFDATILHVGFNNVLVSLPDEESPSGQNEVSVPTYNIFPENYC